MTPRTSAIIVNYRGGDHLLECVRSLLAQTVPVEVLVVDNSPRDPSAQAAKDKFGDAITVLATGRNLGFAGGANEGGRSASGRFLLFLNPDTSLEADCVERLEEALDDESLGVCGPAVLQQMAGRVEYGATIDYLGTPVGLTSPRPPLYVSGCALMTRRDVFASLAGFDERFFMFMEDVDYCWRVLLAGRDVRVVEGARCSHVGGAVAPGGYEQDGRLSTTTFRLIHRERNALAMLLKCMPGATLAWVVPLFVAQAVATALGLLLSGRRRAAAAVLAALPQNVRWLPTTRAQRRRIRSAPRARDRVVRARLLSGIARLSLARRVGIPAVDDEDPR